MSYIISKARYVDLEDTDVDKAPKPKTAIPEAEILQILEHEDPQRLSER